MPTREGPRLLEAARRPRPLDEVDRERLVGADRDPERERAREPVAERERELLARLRLLERAGARPRFEGLFLLLLRRRV